MKIITIIGARPQFIKAATLSRIIKEDSNLTEIIVHTGQHYNNNMSQIFFEELNIPKPNYNLGIGGGNHGEQTGKMLDSIEKVILKEQPDWVFVYGDTNSTLAGALAAAKLHVPIAHVEAGLRSFNKKMPEEINRIITDHLADLLFAPTEAAARNLDKEGISLSKVRLIGDVMYDATIYYDNLAENRRSILKKLHLKSKAFYLATIHRAENTNNKQRLKEIFFALEGVTTKTNVVMPLHPRTKKELEEINWDIVGSKIRFIEPMGYLDMLILEKNAKLIITDSGGLQKEAYFHQVPCITLRNETEWVELVDRGYNTLVKDLSKISEVADKVLSKKIRWDSTFYGNGNAAKSIIANLMKN